MEINYADALGVAMVYYDQNRRGNKFDKAEAARKLAAFGLFSWSEISDILGQYSVTAVKNAVGLHTNESQPSRKWDLNSIDTLYSIALSYQIFGLKYEFKPSIERVLKGGTSLRAVSELTGISLTDLRELVHGAERMGILRTELDPAGR